MKTNICILIPPFLLIMVILSGCGTMRQSATDVVLTGAGGYIGYEASGDKIGGAAIGAGAGYIASKFLLNETDKAILEAEQRGYDRAMNQAVKQQYWIIQNRQRGDAAIASTEPRYVNVSIPETVTADGVILQTTTLTLRTE